MRSCLVVLKQRSGAIPAPMRLLYLTGRKNQMLLDNGTMFAIIIALAGSCFVMVVGIRAQGKLIRENNRLRKELTELYYDKVRGGI
jgi:hypothetical protein